MTKLLRIIAWCFMFIVFVASIVFSYANPAPIALSFGFATLNPQPLAVWVISAFATGGLCGVLLGVGLVRNLRSRLEIRRLRSQLSKAQQDLATYKIQQDTTVVG